MMHLNYIKHGHCVWTENYRLITHIQNHGLFSISFFVLHGKYARLIVREDLNGFLVFCLMSLVFLLMLLVPYAWVLLLQFTIMYVIQA